MKQCVISVLLLIGISASAQASQWVCDARGIEYTNGPAGEITQMVSAYGDTEAEAADHSIDSCTEFGLEQCMVTDCYQQSSDP